MRLSVAFDELGMRADVWRRAGKAVVSDTTWNMAFGTLVRHPKGALLWEPYDSVTAACPIEIFAVIATMI